MTVYTRHQMYCFLSVWYHDIACDMFRPRSDIITSFLHLEITILFCC